jgi:hypothetical protein
VSEISSLNTRNWSSSRAVASVSAGRLRTLAAIGVAALVALGIPAAALAGISVWSVQVTPATNTTSQFDGVACPSASDCLAAGSFVNLTTDSDNPLAGQWNGVAWALDMPPMPSGALAGGFSGISCVTSMKCLAVGSYVSGFGVESPLAEVWNGNHWKSQAPIFPSGASQAVLSGVACKQQGATPYCVAVGLSQVASGDDSPLLETWNGSTWSLVSVPEPSRSINASLASVACASASACMAIGGFNSVVARGDFADHWNGKTWSLESMPNPTGAGLASVSCGGATTCVAVGSTVDDGASPPDSPFVEDWNGTTWTIVATPIIAASALLQGVSCTGATVCEAVGLSYPASGGEQALAERLAAGSWAIQATPEPSTYADLDALRCLSGSVCTAVGLYMDSGGYINTLAEHYG